MFLFITRAAPIPNYYDSYYSNRKFGRKRTKNGAVAGFYNISANVNDASKFKILDYELSVPVEKKWNKFLITFTPVYAIPVNPATVVVQSQLTQNSPVKTRSYQEPLSNSFYFSLELAYKF